MENKLYVSDEIMNEVMKDAEYLSNRTVLDIESYAKEEGYFFSEDDMGNCYLSKDEEASAFNEVCEL